MPKITLSTTVGELIPEGNKCGECIFKRGGYWEDDYCIFPDVSGELHRGQKAYDCPNPPVKEG